jgi:hypothetical protein
LEDSFLIQNFLLSFHDVAQSRPCQVVRVEKEKEVQEYFGLNCLNSVVLADGVKTSTFGKLHTLPAVWFSWMGRVAGKMRFVLRFCFVVVCDNL